MKYVIKHLHVSNRLTRPNRPTQILTLCEDEPGEATIREAVTLIRSAPLSEARKQELISLSLVVASQDVARSILIRIIEEVFIMKTLPPIEQIESWEQLLPPVSTDSIDPP